MSEFNWPHPAYAEDQPYAKTLLYTHVFHRGFEAGGLIGVFLGGYKLYKHRQLLLQKSIANPAAATAAAANTTSIVNKTAMRSIFYPIMARSSLIGAGATMLLTTGRMWGKEEVEWQDRSWRLLENKGQVMHDLYMDVGAGVGAAMGVGSLFSGGSNAAAGFGAVAVGRQIVGRAGLGAVVGLVGCEVVRGLKFLVSGDEKTV